MQYIKDIKVLMDDVRNRMPLSQAIGMYINLERDGAGWSSICPWHSETMPSFKVNDAKSIWKCWGSCSGDKDKAGTDVVKFIQTYFGLSFSESVEKFATDAGLDFSQHYRTPTVDEQWADYYTKINSLVADICHEQLVNTPSACKIMTDKGMDLETLKAYKIGYCSNISTVHAEISNVPNEHLAALDLKRYDMWDDRIVYPIANQYGAVVMFRNRAIKSNVVKFLGTTSTSPVFPSALPLYGFHLVRRHIRLAEGKLIVVEGQNDVLHCRSVGIDNVVGSMGISLSSNHFEMLEKFGTKHLIIMFDGDTAGQTALSRFCKDIVYNGDMILSVASMPAPYDPDDFLQNNPAYALQKIIDSNTHYIDFYLDNACDTLMNTSIEKHGYLHRVKSRMQTISGIHKQLALTKLADKTGLARDVVDDYFRTEAASDVLQSLDAERTVMCGMLTSDECRLLALDKLNESAFSLRKNAQLFSLIKSLLANNVLIDVNVVWLEVQKNHLDQSWSYSDLNLLSGYKTDNWEHFINEVLAMYMRRRADLVADHIKVDIRDSTRPVEDVLGDVNASITDLMMSSNTIFDPSDSASGVMDTMKFIQYQMMFPGRLPGVDLGPAFQCLTQALGGLRSKTMTIVGGLPGVGKTSVMEKWAVYLSVFLKVPVLWLALEMKREALDIRNISILSTMDGGIPITAYAMERGYLDGNEYERVATLAAKLQAAPFYVICDSSMTVQQAIAISRYYKHSVAIQSVFIDYVQLLECEGRFKDDWLMQKAASKMVLDGISRRLDLSVVGASQLNRTAISQGKGDVVDMPGGENVAGSAQWWADADAFIAPFEKSQRHISKWPNMGNHGFNVSKNRNGPTGLIHATVEGAYFSWFEASQQDKPTNTSE